MVERQENGRQTLLAEVLSEVFGSSYLIHANNSVSEPLGTSSTLGRFLEVM